MHSLASQSEAWSGTQLQLQTVAENLHCNIDAFMGGSAIASLMLLTVTFKAGSAPSFWNE